MSIEKKSLISNRAATKKANLTKVNAAAQVSATKVAKPTINSRPRVLANCSAKLNSVTKVGLARVGATLMRG